MASEKSSRKAIHYLIALLLFLVLQEALARLVFPVPEVLNFNRVDYSLTRITPGMQRLRQLSNASFSWTSEPDAAEFVHVLNLYGFRDSDWKIERDENRLRIIFLGDSFVEGLMVPGDGTIPEQFEELALSSGREIEALNMGVSASQVKQYLGLLRDAVPIFRPDQVILVFYANDVPFESLEDSWSQEPLTPTFSNPWQPRILHVLNSLREDRVVPRRWTAEPFPFLGAVPDEGNPWSSPEKAERFSKFVNPALASAMKRGRFNPHIVDAYIRFERKLRTEIHVQSLVSQIEAYTSRWSAQLLLAYIPSRNQVSDAYLRFESQYSTNKNPSSLMGEEYQLHARAIRDSCAVLGVPFLDLTPALRAAEARGERLYWRYDEHMNTKGYALVASAIFEWWERVKG